MSFLINKTVIKANTILKLFPDGYGVLLPHELLKLEQREK
jgi:hypothetical protein